MLNFDLIKTLAKKQQTTELNIRREYVQHLFLSKFYQQELSEKVFFKGGTALRLIYGSPRFSEDLDFSSVFANLQKIEQMILLALREIEREGIVMEIIEAKKTTGGYLGIISFKLMEDLIFLQLEISFREDHLKGEITTVVNDFLPAYTAMILKQEEMIAQKVAALLSRKKPRDFYDLYFLLRGNLLPVSEKKKLPEILKVLKKTKIQFEKELKQFLPKSHWPVIKNFRAVLEREIERY